MIKNVLTTSIVYAKLSMVNKFKSKFEFNMTNRGEIMSEHEKENLKEIVDKYQALPTDMQNRFRDMLIGCSVAFDCMAIQAQASAPVEE